MTDHDPNFINNGNLFQSIGEIIDAYRMPPEELEGANVLIAWYDLDGYEGWSFVLFEKGDQLYEVIGGHCSCNGLEGQWDPEPTSWPALLKREFYGNEPLRLAVHELAKTGMAQ